MASTSDTKPFDAMEQITPFFNRAQLYAFNQPPSQSALGRVNRGGSHDYLPQEYVRALLDRFIGQGRWAIRATLVKTIEEKIQKAGKENIAVTAIVNVELDILSALDPDKRLKYAGIGTHTMEAGADKGIAAAVGNAITSAESKGLKAAAKNLGRAFGSDLKNKLDRDTLPPSIKDYARMLTEREASRAGAKPAAEPAASEPQPTSQEPAQAQSVQNQQPAGEPQHRREPDDRRQPVQRNETRQNDDRGDDRIDDVAADHARSEQAPAPEPVAEQPRRQPQRRQQQPEQAAAADGNGKAGREAPDQAQSGQQPDQAQQSQEGAQDGKPDPKEEWELSIMPSSYSDWLACIRTMGARVNKMSLESEIQNFIRRNKKTINALPTIPAEGDRPERNFPMRFRKIIRERYEALGLSVPTEYQIEVDQAVPQAA